MYTIKLGTTHNQAPISGPARRSTEGAPLFIEVSAQAVCMGSKGLLTSKITCRQCLSKFWRISVRPAFERPAYWELLLIIASLGTVASSLLSCSTKTQHAGPLRTALGKTLRG